MPKVSAASSITSETSTAMAMPESYEAAMAELEQLVGRLESGELPLDHLLSGYQRGAALLQFCREKLQAVEEQIKVLDDGVLKPWKPQ
jgi:exodeoxyribonuclease VII small subunit